MKRKSGLSEREIYKRIRKKMPPPTHAIPDKRDKLERHQFQTGLEMNMTERADSKIDVRVRFAPSPTGFLHIGGARTALYNWLFARHYGGTFVLRIEDTDRARSTQQAIEAILDSLKWLGLDWDEGPYYQMDRLSLYRSRADKLLQTGRAYYCYCLPEEFEERRKAALAKGKMPGYDGKCRDLAPDEIKEFAQTGRKPCIRFKAPRSGQTIVSDLIRGRVSFENSLLDDFIILRSDEIPTYNFAAVVDDGEMGITHVIRGEDHLSNTPKQILVYQALGYKPPVFAHLPMILGKDNAPLSKRHGATAVEEFKEKGYLPEALANYLALLGWAYDDSTTLFSIDELVQKFSLEKVSKSAAVFDIEKLDWMNGSYIRDLPVEELTQKCMPFLKKAGYVTNTEDIKGEQFERMEKMIVLVRERIRTLSEVTSVLDIFFAEELVLDKASIEKVLTKEEAPLIIDAASEVLEQLEVWQHQEIEARLRVMQEELNMKPRVVFQVLRVAVTGRIVSPPLFETLELLGKDEVLKRLRLFSGMLAKS